MSSKIKPVTLPGAFLEVKCLSGCGRDSDAEESVNVRFEPLFHMDNDRFDTYRVEFSDDIGAEVYIQDLLCVPGSLTQKFRCQIRGTMPDGLVFAFPCLEIGPTGHYWVSRPDRNDVHFAVRAPNKPVEMRGVSA